MKEEEAYCGRFLPFSNALMFAVVMHNKALCRTLMERLFPERKIASVRFQGKNRTVEALARIEAYRKSGEAEKMQQAVVEYEKLLINAPQNKAVRFDVLFTDDDGSWTDIEFQAVNAHDLPQRARYYMAMMTTQQLKKGWEYRKLNKSIVIFLCGFDYYGQGEAIYDFSYMNQRLGLHFDDGSSIILVNTRCPAEQIPEGLAPFFHYVNLTVDEAKALGADYESGDKFVDEINRRVCELNEREEIKIMESFGDRQARENAYQRRIGREEGEKIGREEGEKAKQLSILDKMLSMGLSHELISKAVGLPETVILEREKVLRGIETPEGGSE